MKLTVNGEPRDCAATNLDELWRNETADLEIAGPRGFAISLNGAVVRRAAWPTTAGRDGDMIEIIRPMSGGGCVPPRLRGGWPSEARPGGDHRHGCAAERAPTQPPPNTGWGKKKDKKCREP